MRYTAVSPSLTNLAMWLDTAKGKSEANDLGNSVESQTPSEITVNELPPVANDGVSPSAWSVISS